MANEHFSSTERTTDMYKKLEIYHSRHIIDVTQKKQQCHCAGGAAVQRRVRVVSAFTISQKTARAVQGTVHDSIGRLEQQRTGD